MFFTYTAMTAIEPEIEDKNSSISLIPQIRKEILEVVTTHFAQLRNHVVTQDDILNITNKIVKKFKQLRKESCKNITYSPVKPQISLTVYEDQFILVDRERYPTDYNFIAFKIECSKINFWVTIIERTNEIKIAYVRR